MEKALDFAQNNADAFRSQLHDFLRIPSVSTDEAFAEECQRAAQWLNDHLAAIGLTTELIETERHPLVYAEWMGAGSDAPTILIYGHYDVQPAVKEDGWNSDPFEPVERDGKIYARGATDDKGQTFTHIKAVESILKTEGELPVNVKIIIEGEEESGSRGIARYVSEHHERLQADFCVISDTSMGEIEKPMIVYALRGTALLEIKVTGPRQDLHSGMYGGTVHNPIQALCEMLSQLHDETGKVSVPGFYDGVRELSEKERERISKNEYDNVRWGEETGAPLPWGEDGYSLKERVGARPTLEINGIAGGYAGNGFKAIIPSTARAKISCRLVGDQKPEQVLDAVQHYLEKIAPPTVTIEIKRSEGSPAIEIPVDNPAMQAAIRAYVKGWGAEPIFTRMGGSIPIVANFQSKMGLPVILMGFGLDTDNLHGPNEHFEIEMFERGIRTAIHLIYESVDLHQETSKPE